MGENRKWHAIFWTIMACLMLVCFVIDLIIAAPWAACFAMFAFSADGLNAYLYFKEWREWRRRS